MTLTKTELLIIFESAAFAMSEVGTFDEIAMCLDISEDELTKVKEKLEKYLRGYPEVTRK